MFLGQALIFLAQARSEAAEEQFFQDIDLTYFSPP